MADFRWREAGEVIEHYLPKIGRPLIKISMVCGALFVVGIGLWWFFGKFVGEVLWPFLINIFGAKDTGITLDNIEAIIIVLITAVSLFIIVFILLSVGVLNFIRRRVVPQTVVDQLAELRSRGIHILNRRPHAADKLSDQEREDYVLHVWKKAWKEWGDEVVVFLGTHFTVAEKLSFARLGVIRENPFGSALTPEHNHYSMLLAKQITILEDLIQGQLERH